MPSPNEQVRIQVRVSDIPQLLDAVEGRLEDYHEHEQCGDGGCHRCTLVRGALLRLRDNILKAAPKVEGT